MNELMKCTCPCFTPHRTALAEIAQEIVSLPRLAMLSTRCFSKISPHNGKFNFDQNFFIID